MDNIEFIETNKGKPAAIYQGIRYRMQRTFLNGNTRWVCSKEKSAKCRGSMITKKESVKTISKHCCKPDPVAMEVHKQIMVSKKRAREEDAPIAKMYAEEVTSFFNQDYELLVEIPSKESFKHSLNRIKRKPHGPIKEATTAEEILIPDDLVVMEDGTSFLFADDRTDEGRIMVFSTKKGMEALENAEIVFIDETFRSCSKQFTHIYIRFT